MYKIGVDIGGTKINVGVFSGGGALLACQKLKIADIADSAEAVSGAAAELEEKLSPCKSLFMDFVPLTLEEIFIYELGGADYEVKDIVL